MRLDRRRPVPTVWVSHRDALRMLLRGATLGSAVLIAAFVGTWRGFIAARRRRNVERLVALLGDQDTPADEQPA